MRLDHNDISISNAQRAKVSGLGAQEPRAEGLALPNSGERGNLCPNMAVTRRMSG